MNYSEIAEFSIVNIHAFENRKYMYGSNSFKRNRKWNFMDFIAYILCNTGQTTTLEIENFVDDYFGGDEDKIITKQALSKQRQNINPIIFKDMNYDFVENVFKSKDYVPYFKDYKVILIDGSKSELPNDKQTLKEFDVPENTKKYTQPARTLFSTCIDLKTGFVLDSILGNARDSERNLLKEHIESLEKHMDFSNTILIIDRGYYSLELLLYLENKGINYIFRLKNNIYIDERYFMESNDEYLDIKLNSNRIQNIKDENLKLQAKNMKIISKRFVNHELKDCEGKKSNETLLTNLPPEIASYEELKNLYNDRWEIELNYEKIKNKLHIENYSGRTEITIKQDFYSQMYIFNIYLALRNHIQNELEDENQKIRKEKNKEKRPNNNTVIGRIKKKIIKLLLANIEEIKEIFVKIIKRSKKDTTDHKFDRKSTIRNKKIFSGKYRSSIRPNGT